MNKDTQIHLPAEVVQALNNNQNKLNIVRQLMGKTGQIVTITSNRPLKLLKRFKDLGIGGEKKSIFQARAGISYENLSSVMAKRAAGEPEGELLGREWVEFPYINKSTKTGQLNFRFYNIKNSFVPKVEYWIGGIKVEPEVARDYCMSTEFEKHENECFDMPIDTIIAIK